MFFKFHFRQRARKTTATALSHFEQQTITKTISSSDGCHHCGRKRGRVIGDHIPPNKVAYGSRGAFPGGSYPTSANNPWAAQRSSSNSSTSSSSSSNSSSSSSSAAALANAASQFITTAARSQPRGGGGYGIFGGGGNGRGAGGADAAAMEVVGGLVGGSLRLLWSAGSAALRAASGGKTGGGGRKRHVPMGRQARAWVARQRLTAQWKVKEFLGLNPARQRYFPQCRPCSQLQAVAVRTGKRTLKTHAGGSKPWCYSVS